MQSFRRNVIGAVLEAAIGYCMWCECVKSYSKIQKTEKPGIEFNFHTFFSSEEWFAIHCLYTQTSAGAWWELWYRLRSFYPYNMTSHMTSCVECLKINFHRQDWVGYDLIQFSDNSIAALFFLDHSAIVLCVYRQIIGLGLTLLMLTTDADINFDNYHEKINIH